MGTHVIAVVGATATGKSGLAIALARALGGEIVNADSMQLYRGMDIGTAKEPETAWQGVPHHLLDIWPVTRTANVADYQKLARAATDDIIARGRIPVLVGGSGLYLRAALDDLHFPRTDHGTRARLESELADLGAAGLHARLAGLDPAAAAAILPSNGRRIVRALEVIELTGRPFTASMPTYEQVRPAVQVGLTLPRPELDERIAARVDRMWQAGFEAEVTDLTQRGLRDGKTASRALGYQQMLRHLDGELTLDQARDETVKATRRFARRQESWFRRDPRIRWLGASQPPDTLLTKALRLTRCSLYDHYIWLLHLIGELVGALSVVGAEHPGQAHHGPFGKMVFLQARGEEAGQRGPEQCRPQVIQLRQPERVRGVQELAERREL
jgi:tRNA dimethylallyltransferase